MKTKQISPKEILSILAGYEQVTSENFFSHIPEVLCGGQLARDFGKQIHQLARDRLLTSKSFGTDIRVWQITALGRAMLLTGEQSETTTS